MPNQLSHIGQGTEIIFRKVKFAQVESKFHLDTQGEPDEH